MNCHSEHFHTIIIITHARTSQVVQVVNGSLAKNVLYLLWHCHSVDRLIVSMFGVVYRAIFH